jgi:hypothetical protein
MTAHVHSIVVLACGAAKSAHACEVQQLYTSATWEHFLRAAKQVAACDAAYFGHRSEVVVLSAKHGLVDLEDVLAPYDVAIGDEDSVSVDELVDQLVVRAPKVVMSLLPNGYLMRLQVAVATVNEKGSEEDPWIEFLDVFEAGFGPRFGIGYQRGIASKLAADSQQVSGKNPWSQRLCDL